jgi:hypothetical protein
VDLSELFSGRRRPEDPTALGGRYELGEELLDSPVDVVDDGADRLDGQAGGVLELPVEVALAGIDGAGITAAHGDHDVGGLGVAVSTELGELPGRVESALFEDGDDGGVELVCGFGPGGADLDPALGVVFEQDFGGHAATGVVDADEQHDRGIAHEIS